MDCDTATRDTGCDTTMTTQFIDKRQLKSLSLYERTDRVSACRQVLAQQQPQDDYYRDPCLRDQRSELRALRDPRVQEIRRLLRTSEGGIVHHAGCHRGNVNRRQDLYSEALPRTLVLCALPIEQTRLENRNSLKTLL